MKRIVWFVAVALFMYGSAANAKDVVLTDDLGVNVTAYFDGMFAKLKMVADVKPTAANFRQIAQPVFKNVRGLFGGSLIDDQWVIRQSLFAIHAMARGFSLKKVAELQYFQAKMAQAPGPQLSEPGHGSLVQPRLIALRYPVMKDGKVVSIVSMMVRTESFLQAVGLSKVKAFRITCLGKVAETRGKLSATPRVAEVSLPSTIWRIEYE
ncbi:MAG: hypothetical protein HQL19_05540 [Candidatus Omnitrophica bacterium]|nr:hypothetical protein [Candidatus Omnitrophota bacterium]